MRQTYDGNPVYDHARFLEDFLLKNNLRHGAELGVWRGNTTIYLLKRIETLSLIAVDSWEGNHIRHKEHFLSRIGGLDGRLTIHHMPTDEACAYVDDNSLEFVFIDADHNYLPVKKDIQSWISKIKTGGFLMGHDKNHPGVSRALSELIPKHKTGAGGCWYMKVTDEMKGKISIKQETPMLADQALTAFIAEVLGNTGRQVLNIGDTNTSKHTVAMQKAGIELTTVNLTPPADIECPYQSAYAAGQDAIWCSHCLEHQVNPGLFLDKIFSDLNEGGLLALTVPPHKEQLVGGHVTIWNKAALTHQLVMAGFDCSRAMVWQYDYNITALLRKKSLPAVQWKMNKQDLPLLKKYTPEVLWKK